MEQPITPMLQMHPHPLLVDHIVENILNYLSTSNLSQLINLRRVCTQWNLHATKILHKKYYLSFGGHKYNVGKLKSFLEEFEFYENQDKNTTDDEDIKLDENANQLVIAESSPTGRNGIAFPVTRFRLFSDLFQESNKSTVLKFMKKCGPIAESLVIFKDINSDIEYTTEELSQFSFPRLKHVIFSDRRRSGFSQDANNQSFLFQLVSSSAATTLTSLSIKFPREPIYEIYEKEQLVLKIFQVCHLPRLKFLKLDMSITDKVLNCLAGTTTTAGVTQNSLHKLTLKTLHLSLGASQFKPESLKGLLHSLRNTLEDLRLTDLYRRASLIIDLPSLNNLKSFEVHGLELPAYFVTFPNFCYSSKMPNLTCLKLNTFAPIKSWEVFIPSVGEDKEEKEERAAGVKLVKGIRELSLAMNFDCPILMRRIALTFLGVRVLEMHFSRSVVPALQVVFGNMPQLEELTLNQSYLGEISTNCVDDVLTGLEAEECKWILKKKAYKMMDLSGMEKKPNLLDLKNLKRLDLLGLRHRNLITDVCAYLIFLKMDQLVILDVGRSQLSDTCLRDLSVRFPQGKFQKYLTNKKVKTNESSIYSRHSAFSGICAIQ